MYPLITLEEHWLSRAVEEIPKIAEVFKAAPASLTDRLHDLDSLRLSDMDAGQVACQVISHVPAKVAPPEKCRAANDELREAVSKHPSRLAGFAMLSMAEPHAAAEELERCVKEHGFLGALIENHLDDGTYYDDYRFWPVFAKAQELDVPIYLHPAFPGHNIEGLYKGNFSFPAQMSMATGAWGWHSEVGFHLLRLFASGLFDEYPRLKLLLGHDGEMVPFLLERIEEMSQNWGDIKRDFKTVWDENVWVTTSGMFSVNPLSCVLRNTKIDRILYSVDWPFANNTSGLEFIHELQKGDLVTEEQLQMIAYKNAEKLLKIKVT